MKDYYKTLGVDRSASASRIKGAYRTLCKRYHPDRNKSVAATQTIQEINEAYDVLSDPDKKATYDYELRNNSRLQETRTAAQRSQSPPAEERVQEVRCERCGREDATLRLSVFYRIVSVLFYAQKSPSAHLYCAACRVRESLLSNAICMTIGWWQIVGFFWNLEAIFKNSCGGSKPKEPNAKLLALLGYNLFRKGKLHDAVDALTASLKFHRDTDVLDFLRHIQSEGGKPKESDFWEDLLARRLHPAYYNVALFGALIWSGSLLVRLNSPPAIQVPYSQRNPSPSSTAPSYYRTPRPAAPVFNEPQMPLPDHGVFSSAFGYLHEGCPFKLRTRADSGFYLVKLEEWYTQREVATYFVYGGMLLETLIPPNSYRLKYANGQLWYGRQFLFGPDTAYSVANAKLDFTETSDGYNGHTIELILQRHGNLSTKQIRPADF